MLSDISLCYCFAVVKFWSVAYTALCVNVCLTALWYRINISPQSLVKIPRIPNQTKIYQLFMPILSCSLKQPKKLNRTETQEATAVKTLIWKRIQDVLDVEYIICSYIICSYIYFGCFNEHNYVIITVVKVNLIGCGSSSINEFVL